MNLRALSYLVALADLRHFGKAAKSCFVSQPTLSMQIKALESSLGVQLLERNRKSVLFTDIGTIVADRARVILTEVEAIKEAAKLAKNPHGGELKIGIIPTVAPYLLPTLAPKIYKAFPKLTLYWVEEQTETLLNQLKHGKLDAAILALPIAEKDFISTPFFEEEFLLAVANSHPFAHKKSIKENDLKKQELLLLEEGHCLRDQALDICHKMGGTENKSFRATSLETLRYMVIAGVGVTLMPKMACKANVGISYIPFIAPKPSRVIGIIWRNSTPKKPLLKEFSLLFPHLLKP